MVVTVDVAHVTTLSPPLFHPPDVNRATGAARRAGASTTLDVWAWGLGALVLLVAAGSRLAYWSLPFDGDGAMFAYMGKLVTEGGRFGVDLVDNKFPTVGLITSVFYRAFGDAWAGYVLGQFALTLLTSALLARQAARSFGPHARPATFWCAVTLLNLNAAVMGGFQLETLTATFTGLAACGALAALSPGGDRRDALLCGLSAGCAALVKPTGLGVMGAFALAVLVSTARDPGRARRRAAGFVAWCLAGAALPLLSAALYLIETDTLRQLPTVAAQISSYARNSSFSPEDLFRPISVLVLFASAMLVRGWVFRRERHRTPSTITPEMVAFVALWLVVEFAGVLMQRRMYAYHFLPLALPAALAFASIPRRSSTAQLAGVLALPVALSAWGALDVWRSAAANPPTWPAVAAWLDRHTLPGERVWRDVTPAVLIGTDLRPASRVQLTFLFMNDDAAPARFSGMLLDDWERHRPRYVVLPSDVPAHVAHQTAHVFELSRLPARAEAFARAWGEIDHYVAARYEPVETIGRETIHRRVDREGLKR